MKKNKNLLESPFSPFYRHNLLQECLGKKIKCIRRFYSCRFLEQFHQKWYPKSQLNELFDVGGDGIYIEFSNNLVLNITTFAYWIHLTNSCYSLDGQIRDQFNQYYNSKYYSKIKTKLVNTEIDFKYVIGAEIQNVFLLEETDYFNSFSLISKRSDSNIGGFGFETNKGKILFCKGDFEDDKRWHNSNVNLRKKKLKYLQTGNRKNYFVNYKCLNVILDCNDETLNKEVYNITYDFFKPGQDYIGRRNRFKTNNFNRLKFKSLEKHEIVKGTLIDTRITLLRNNEMNKDVKQSFVDIISGIIKNYPKLIIKDQLIFFTSLYNQLSKTENAIVDLMVGLDDELNFVLIEPYDVVPNYYMDMQYHLLQRIISYLNEIIPNHEKDINL